MKLSYFKAKMPRLLYEYGPPFLFGCFVFLVFPPFNQDTGWIFGIFPVFSFLVYIPLFRFSLKGSVFKGGLYSYIYGVSASLFMYYWIANVVVDDLWPLILAGTFLLILLMGCMYLILGLAFRVIYKKTGRFSIVVFPCFWVVLEWLRTLGDMSFPWAFSGYSMVSWLPVAQIAAVTGVYGLSWIVVFVNTLVYEAVFTMRGRGRIYTLLSIGILLGVLYLSGVYRMKKVSGIEPETLNTAVLQTNMNQADWGDKSIDSLMEITGRMYKQASSEYQPDLIVLPESALFCYLDREYSKKKEFLSWTRESDSDVITGTLDFQTEDKGYKVYNSVFFLGKGQSEFEKYYKMKLVPFSEALPFEGLFPILSRVNLGQSDFSRGREERVFELSNNIKPAPFICYEILYPGFVRKRVQKDTDIILNLTNDGWFGRSTAPYLHEAMARTRAIENGLPLLRGANSGISSFSDACGRAILTTDLYDRDVLHGELPLYDIDTFYRRAGNWIVWCSAVILSLASCLLILRSHRETRG